MKLMLNLIAAIETKLQQILSDKIKGLFVAHGLDPQKMERFAIEYTPNKPFGDFASNIAMVNAKHLQQPPQKIAEMIASEINLAGTQLKEATVRSGFINFRMANDFYKTALGSINEMLAENPQKQKRIILEYVSANPTGPMHLGNARGGAIGDCLGNIMARAGYSVTKEFFVNDSGNQVALFKQSLDARLLQELKGEQIVEFPEDGYHGADIKQLAHEYIAQHGDEPLESSTTVRETALLNYALEHNIANMVAVLEKYRVRYDSWFKESSLIESAAVKDVIMRLSQKGLTYTKDGALWYRFSKANENTKDEVLERANGKYTYFATDIAYHANKLEKRKFDRCINIWGADHHGHVERLKNALLDLGIDPARLTVLLMQVVRLVKDGKVVKMSKRSGNAVTLEDLLDEVSVDAARFFFNFREINTHFDFDMDLAIEESNRNPVYYIQYAHARICSIMRKAQDIPCVASQPDIIFSEPEQELIKCLIAYPVTVEEIATTLNSSLLDKYLMELAAMFHKFYSTCKVFSDTDAISQHRLLLCDATRSVLGDGLALLNISAPQQM
ncbi:MAG: arginine--tRNA ligase [Oscillospiraceae bacterium]|jgi:arginyl-tRNA synthetase|nr:arginine--tRNA ligase [Oscillospiraceae bacterium]